MSLTVRPFGAGHAMLPSGTSTHPVPRSSSHHRSIGQRLPELWADFSERPAVTPDSKSLSLLGGGSAAGDGASPQSRRGCLFVGYAEFDMDGRVHTAGEVDRIMAHAASSKFPCARPATLAEYTGGLIQGLPQKNGSRRDVVFVGPGSSGTTLFHVNTLGVQKKFVPPGDLLDGTAETVSMYGRKCCLCVYPLERVRRQQSLTQFGLARGAVGASGHLRRAGSMASLRDTRRSAPSPLLLD